MCVRMAWISFGALPCSGEKKTLYPASRCCWNLARPWHASELVPFLVGLRTYQHTGITSLKRQNKVTVLIITGEWRRLHNEELNDLYCSPNIVRVIKSRRMKWVGHVARMGEDRGVLGSWWGNRREGDHWGDLGVDGWIILGWICRRWDVGIWTGLGWPRIRTGVGRLWVR